MADQLGYVIENTERAQQVIQAGSCRAWAVPYKITVAGTHVGTVSVEQVRVLKVEHAPEPKPTGPKPGRYRHKQGYFGCNTDYVEITADGEATCVTKSGHRARRGPSLLKTATDAIADGTWVEVTYPPAADINYRKVGG